MIKWGAPQVLYWLWLVIPLAWLTLRLLRRRERRLTQLADEAVLPILAPERLARRARTRNWLWLGALTLALLALARPQWGFHWEEVRRRGLDIMIVLDTSKSMLAQDIKPNRLQQAKSGIRDLLGKIRGDRVGLVSFAGGSFLQCPLTIDYAAFTMMLDDVYAGIIPRGGTAIAQALKTAIAAFDKQRSDADKAIVLITDGEDHEGNPLALLDDLKKRGIRIYAIGVGTLEGDLIPVADESGGTGFLKDRSGQVIKSALREDVLGKLALDTGGAYVRTAPGDLGLERVFEESISKLKRDETDTRMAKMYEDRFEWFLGGALVLLVIEAVLRERATNHRQTEEAK